MNFSNYIDIEFTEPNQLKFSYPILEGDSLVTKTKILQGKRKKKYWEYYFHNEQTNIPFVFGRIQQDRVRIGKNETNHLLVEKYTDTSGWILIFGDGFTNSREFTFYKYDEYPDMKPFSKGKLWGISLKGKTIIEPKYEMTNIFKSKYIKVKENGKMGTFR